MQKASLVDISCKVHPIVIKCNPDPIHQTKGMTLDCHTVPLSNWSTALEIERLARIKTIKDWEPEYQFHKDGCPQSDKSEDSEAFYKQGKSKVGGQYWQCKTCKKKTNLLPSSKQ